MKCDLSLLERSIKRSFDIFFSFVGLVLTSWVIILCFLVAAIETKSNGFFAQHRVGKNGFIFKVIKVKTMKQRKTENTTVTTSHDMRITKSGKVFRKWKLDELPQLWNVLKGDMSFVGPRPDVPGYADQLEGEDRIILNIRPGITGPATIHYKNEEELLAAQDNPEQYNAKVIYPHKVQINKEYITNYSFIKDLYYIMKTLT
ncbi:sugar transferase [Salibacterium salarium]|uniref:Sugar transferase n=1 Tax=Salibacterium salarium TaxID=284579 RepID=A0A428N0H7_9BACI|nr:sugar transferase [Salibacterium salarium]RSL31858.1 sugar transferase [Salibacterium salarium]